MHSSAVNVRAAIHTLVGSVGNWLVTLPRGSSKTEPPNSEPSTPNCTRSAA